MKKKEKEYIKKIENNIDNIIIRERIVYLLTWYAHKSTRNKRLYFIFAVVSIIAPALITFINSCLSNVIIFGMKKTYVISLISTLATIFAGILAITRWQDGWLRYRKTAELIKTKVSIYLVKRSNISDDIDIQKIDDEFICEIEDIVQDEGAQWLNMRKKDLNNGNKK